MKSPKQNCPRCNSAQSFRPLHRDTQGRPGVIEVYIRCTTCRWEHVLRKSTSEIEILSVQETKLAAQGAKEVARYGVVKGSTAKLLQRTRERMSLLRREAEIA